MGYWGMLWVLWNKRNFRIVKFDTFSIIFGFRVDIICNHTCRFGTTVCAYKSKNTSKPRVILFAL